INPNDHLTIFCSEKNRSTWFDHWEVPVYPQVSWKRFVGFTDPPANWRDLSFNDAGWANAIGGVGYGDGDDSTVVPPSNAIFMRTSFTIADTSIIPIIAMLIDYDDGFVAYLNGIEIARANVGAYGDYPGYNVSAYDEHEAQMYQTGNFSGAFFVDPEIVDLAIKPGLNVLAIQTHNYPGGLDDLTCIPYLLLGVADTNVTYFPFAADIHLHTNFDLDSDGHTLYLKDASGNVIDQQYISELYAYNSRGRLPDGTGNWCLMNTATPDTTNASATCYVGYAEQPVFSLQPGFYSGTQSLSISSSTPGNIHYTRDGSWPTTFSPLYTSAISIDSNQVIRCKVFPSIASLLPSPEKTGAYFIDETVTLPVISLTANPADLFDWNYGIYMMGPNADTVNIPFFGANFWNEWERYAYIEFFDENKIKGFETSSAIKIQGNYSKAWPQKGFSVKARDNVGGDEIDYPLFPDKPAIKSYKSFNIRNAGSDWNTCHMRDRFAHKTVQNTHIDIMDGRPCVLYINGDYFGVYELRERQDDRYVSDNSGVDAVNFDFLEFDGSVKAGTNEHFYEMVTYVVTNDMTIPQKYDSVKVMLDIENFVDYFATETYIVNIDWLGSYTNNIKYWRQTSPPGKWRYILWDVDLSLSFAEPFAASDETYDMLDVAVNPPTWNPHSGMLSSLLNNTEFKNYFVNRYADLMNTIFLPANMHSRADAMHDEMFPEMARHFQLWGNSFVGWLGLIGRANDVPTWEIEIDSMLSFCDRRSYYARNYIQSQFGINSQVDVTLDVLPAGTGTIHLNTIDPTPMPWTGVYFDDVPVTMTATPESGYKFLYWTSEKSFTGNNTLQTLTINVDSNDTFTAHFAELGNFMTVYPNPFNNVLNIYYEIKEDEQVEISMYNALGQKVKNIVSPTSFQEEGYHELSIPFPDYGIKTGIYFVVFKSGEHTEVKRVIRTLE
ncbi:MAG: CotH kinase family protein, partial [Flavobacteriales bacterium]